MTPFRLVELEHPYQLMLLSQHLQLYIFRGQADATWQLMSSLERAYLRYPNTIYSLENNEYWMIHEFSSKYHLYSRTAPRVENKFEWLALMQHHGAATRLLDFSDSLYVAAFFATLNANADSAIWAMSAPLLRKQLFGTGRLAYRPKKDLKDVFNRHHIDLFNGCVARQHKIERKDAFTHLIPLRSESLFDRASRQQSLFVAAGYLGDIGDRVSYMENLYATFPGLEAGYKEQERIEVEELCEGDGVRPAYNHFAVLKIVLPRALHKTLKEELAQMGLSEETLFPGLDGLARSITDAHIRGI